LKGKRAVVGSSQNTTSANSQEKEVTIV